ncbi:hypothetical protein AtEden1_Chr4g0288541 [Arabidopsis thaliana]
MITPIHTQHCLIIVYINIYSPPISSKLRTGFIPWTNTQKTNKKGTWKTSFLK